MSDIPSMDPMDPADVDYFTWDWSGRLGGVPIDSSTWTVSGELQVVSDTFTGTHTQVWLQAAAGAAVPSFPLATNRITAGVRRLERSFYVPLRER